MSDFTDERKRFNQDQTALNMEKNHIVPNINSYSIDKEVKKKTFTFAQSIFSSAV